MSQRGSGYDRKADEEYPTPAWCAEIIFWHLRHRYPYSRKGLTIWEPAAGHPALADALSGFGFRVIASKDDFFDYKAPPEEIDCICTNPPYGIDRRGKMASDFIRHALKFDVVRFVVMLLPIDFDSAKSRVDLFRDNRRWAEKVVLLDRIKWFEGPAQPSVNHCWCIWDRKHRGAPRISYRERSK